MQAGGSFPELPYTYTDDHLSDIDNDTVEDFPKDNNHLSRDSGAGVRGGGGGEGGGDDGHSNTTSNTTTALGGNKNGHDDTPLATKRLKLEPVEFAVNEASAGSVGETPNVQGRTQIGQQGEDSNVQRRTQPARQGEDLNGQERSQLGPQGQGGKFTGSTGVAAAPGVGRDSGGGGQDGVHHVRKSSPFGNQTSPHQASHAWTPGSPLPRLGPSRHSPWAQPQNPFSHPAPGMPAGAGGLGATVYSNAPTSTPAATVCGAVGGTLSGGPHGSDASVSHGMVLVEEDDDWLFGRYLVSELKKVKNFKDKQLAKLKMQQIVTYAQLGMGQQLSSDTTDIV